MSPDLVLLTSRFPYGNSVEAFLESEIDILARRFNRVFVLPSSAEEGCRPLPGNVILVEMEWLRGFGRWERTRALLSKMALGVLRYSFGFRQQRRALLLHGRPYLNVLGTNVLKTRLLRRFLSEHALEAAIVYDYWFENSTLAAALLRREGSVRTAVARGHRFDIYDEEWGGPVPFREFKATNLDLVAPISEHGAGYLRDRLPGLDFHMAVHRLGVRRQESPGGARHSPPLVLSCSTMLERKCVSRIPEVLRATEMPLRWVHFGDGPERPKVERAASQLPPHVQWELRGHVDNQALLSFYRTSRVDVLLSLSLSEGLPVSMMEALSFGVPVVALGTQGIPEIVTETTGILLDPDATTDVIARRLEEAVAPHRFDPGIIRAFFEENFLAEANFNAFADALIALHSSSGLSGLKTHGA